MNETIEVTYISHATALISLGGDTILTDPLFGNSVLGVKRQVPLAYDPARLPKLSAVLISHAHLDHLDRDSFKYIKDDVPIIVPEGISPAITPFVNNPVIELATWASHTFPDGLTICATDARHTGGRISQLRYKNTNSYVISKAGKSVFFTGDSGYGTHFKNIGNMYKIDVALLPIACYLPRWFMQSRHMNPIEAVQAFLDLNAGHMIPIHWGSFKLSLENINEPAEWLKRISSERGIEDKVHILEQGKSWSASVA